MTDKRDPERYALDISDRCLLLEAEAAAAGSRTLGGATRELQAATIRAKAQLIAGLPLPRWVRLRLLDRIVDRHWPEDR